MTSITNNWIFFSDPSFTIATSPILTLISDGGGGSGGGGGAESRLGEMAVCAFRRLEDTLTHTMDKHARTACLLTREKWERNATNEPVTTDSSSALAVTRSARGGIGGGVIDELKQK